MQFRLCNMMGVDCSAYLTRVDHGSPMTQVEQREAWSRHRDHLRTVLHDFGSRVDYEESQGSSDVVPVSGDDARADLSARSGTPVEHYCR